MAQKNLKFMKVGLLFAIFIIWVVAYTDRANMTILVTNKAFTDTFGITGNLADQGLLMTLFLLPYGLSNFIVGPIIDKFKARRVLLIAFVIWGVCTAISGLLSSFMALLILRIILGISEAPTTPALHRVVKNWFPANERGLANAIWLTGTSIAPVIGLPIVSWIMLSQGWRESFYWLGAIGVIVPFAIMWFLLHDSPNGQIAAVEIPKPEPDLYERNTELSTFKKKEFWFLTGCNAMVLGFNWGLTSWFPSYLHNGLHVNAVATGILAGAPWMGNVVVQLICGPLSDKLRRRTTLLILAPVIAAVLMATSLLFHNIVAIVIISSLATGINYFAVNVNQAHLQRITNPVQTATAGGVFNGITYVWSSAIPYIMGLVLGTTNSYNLSFVFIILTAVIAGIFGIGVFRREQSLLPVKTLEPSGTEGNFTV